MVKGYDFCGWVTKNDLECSDGRVIRQDAFAHQDGAKVPLVWMHNHDDLDAVIGYTILENRPEGVYGYSFCNDTPKGKNAKLMVEHGDINSYSIFANKLKQVANNVVHGAIKEVSLVLSGANPGAYIEDVSMSHSDGVDSLDEAKIYTGEELMIYEDRMQHADESENSEEEVTLQDVIDSMTDEQREALSFLVGMALQDAKSGSAMAHSDEEDYEDEEDSEDDSVEETEEEENEEDYAEDMEHSEYEGEDDMKTNTFDNSATISHADMTSIISDAKKCGSLADAYGEYLQHDDAHGIVYAQDKQDYFVNDPSFLFPEFKSINNTPDWIKRDTEWVAKVMGSVHHTPFARVKSMYANITEDEARAKGYIKGKEKKEEVFTLLKRTTDPQTIYKKQKMDRDDIIDITDFDVVAWIKGEMRMMLDEEIARAILIGDGRLSSSDDKISEDHVRPVYTDASLYTIRKDVTGADSVAKAKNMISDAVRARKDYKGSGTPTLFTTEEWLTEMLLLEDGIGHRLYKTETELATAMRVSSIVTVPVMEGVSKDNKDLMGIIVNLADYNVGADKGGAVELFDDFDIDFNQFKYLIETRCSGALVKPKSAIVLETASAAG